MGGLLETLQQLQEVELRLAVIRGKRAAKTRRIDELQRKLRFTDGRIEEGKKAIRDHQVKVDALTLDILAREDAVNKHREALNKAKTNKEYANILAAMNTEKADTAKVESAVLEMMEQSQVYEEGVKEHEVVQAQLIEYLDVAKAALASLEEQTKDEHDRLQESRSGYSSSIPSTTLSSFTRVAERHEGEAMAALQRIHPRRDDYVCSGCNITVSLEVVNALHSRDEIQACKSCGRILFIDRD